MVLFIGKLPAKFTTVNLLFCLKESAFRPIKNIQYDFGYMFLSDLNTTIPALRVIASLTRPHHPTIN